MLWRSRGQTADKYCAAYYCTVVKPQEFEIEQEVQNPLSGPEMLFA